MMSKVVFSFVLLVSLISTGLGSRCYVCDSYGNPGCSDPFSLSSSSGQQCGLSDRTRTMWKNLANVFPGIQVPMSPAQGSLFTPVCFKVTGKTSDQRHFTVRDCSYFGSQTCTMIESDVQGMGGQVHECKICTGDLCNSAITTTAPIFAIITAVLSTIFY